MASVTIYTRQLCGFCSRAKALLSQKGVAFLEHDATMSPQIKAEMIQRSGGAATFPQIFVGDTHVGGCDDLFALERAGKLDALLAQAAEASS
ncbi:MAG: glutaredoxin 3 [Devosiaceae bacterium]|nr:glutaredoxin 3 [Devosiaceae bacterium MH13]